MSAISKYPVIPVIICAIITPKLNMSYSCEITWLLMNSGGKYLLQNHINDMGEVGLKNKHNLAD